MFGALGLPEGIILLALAGFFLRRGALASAGPVLVLRKFQINSTGPVAVEIEGRPSGVVAWLLTTIGMDTLTTLTVTDEQVSFKSASLSGEFHQVIPASAISSTHCGYTQPIWLVVMAAFVALMAFASGFSTSGGAGAFLTGLLFAALLLVVYFFQRTITLTVETTGGMVKGVSFKPSAIEQVSVDLKRAMDAVERINGIVIARSKS